MIVFELCFEWPLRIIKFKYYFLPSLTRWEKWRVWSDILHHHFHPARVYRAFCDYKFCMRHVRHCGKSSDNSTWRGAHTRAQNFCVDLPSSYKLAGIGCKFDVSALAALAISLMWKLVFCRAESSCIWHNKIRLRQLALVCVNYWLRLNF